MKQIFKSRHWLIEKGQNNNYYMTPLINWENKLNLPRTRILKHQASVIIEMIDFSDFSNEELIEACRNTFK